MRKEDSTPTSTKLRRLVRNCLVCNEKLDGHRFIEMATAVATPANKEKVQQLIHEIKMHNWESMVAYEDFEGDKNAAIVYSIMGPHSGGMVVLIRDPSELYESPELYVREQIDAQEKTLIERLFPHVQWKNF